MTSELTPDVAGQQHEQLCAELSRARLLLGIVIKHVGGHIVLTHREIDDYDAKHSTVELSHPSPFEIELMYVNHGGGTLQ